MRLPILHSTLNKMIVLLVFTFLMDKKWYLIAHGHRQQGGEGQGRGWGDWVEMGKGERMEDFSNSVNN